MPLKAYEPLDISAIQRCLNGHEGKVLLEYLRDTYDCDTLAKATVEQTYFALGAREVYRNLLHLMSGGDENAT